MTSTAMLRNPMVLFSFLAALACCNGQDARPSEHTSPITVTIGDTVSEVGRNIRCIYQDSQNNLWFASDGEGLFRYDGKSILHFTEKNGLCGDNVRLIQQDKDGSLLIAAGNGISRFDGRQFTTLHHVDDPLRASDLTNFVLLCGDYYQDASLKAFHIPHTSRLTRSYSGDPYAVYCSYKDSKGVIWFGTESRGVGRYDGASFSWLDTEELGLAVRCICEDRSGNIWIGNNGYGLFRYDGRTVISITKIYHLENPDFQTTLTGREGTLARVWSMTADKEGNLWIGTIDAGLWKYDGKGLTNYTMHDGLPGNSISSVFCDNTGRLWIGAENGVGVYDGVSFSVWRRPNTNDH